MPDAQMEARTGSVTRYWTTSSSMSRTLSQTSCRSSTISKRRPDGKHGFHSRLEVKMAAVTPPGGWWQHCSKHLSLSWWENDGFVQLLSSSLV